MPKIIWLVAASGWTVFVTVLCLVSFSDLPTVNVSGVDKYVHATFHFVFAVLWYQTLKSKSRSQVATLVLVVLMSLVFGVALELLQGALTQTRHADAKDVVANSVGALVAATLLFGYSRWAGNRP